MDVEVPVTQARAQLADLVNRVVYAGDRVVLTRHGRPVAAIVPAAELERADAPQPPLLTVLDTSSQPAHDAAPPLAPAAQRPELPPRL